MLSLLSAINGSLFGIVLTIIGVHLYLFGMSFKGTKKFDTIGMILVIVISIVGPIFIYFEKTSVDLLALDDQISGYFFMIVGFLNFAIYGYYRGIYKR